ncbi:hypothetical protein CPB85DRAFT_1334842 [Mucidula mucida]|nr:hypothetical protein CPB85DRAFT_1334798 [Mucidula mucida]KAF8888003.1 hypothetical protein CPB85DRAFT_1334842 [Mucidula mucida]
MKLTQIFTALVTLTFISTVQAGYCYCRYQRLDPIMSSTKYVLLSLPARSLTLYRQCCLDVMGTDTLHHVFLGKDIYCDTGDESYRYRKCCESKGDLLYCN